MLRVWAVMLCLALVPSAPCRAATPYTVDDLIALESLGQVMIDPAERLVLVERRRPHDGATDYAYGPFENRALSNIYVASLTRPGNLALLFPQETGAGYWIGGFSPSGKRLSVFRLINRRLDVGTLDMATRHVTWLDIAPDLPIAHPAPSWIDDDTLIVVARRDRQLPIVLSIGNALQTDLARLWANAAGGLVPSSTVATTRGVSTEAGERQVIRVDLASGRQTILASGAITDVAVSKRGPIAIVRTVAPVQPPVETPIAPDFVSLRHVIEMVASDGGGQLVRIADDVLPATLAWDDSGQRLAFVSRKGGRDWTRARYQVASMIRARTSVRSFDVTPVIVGKQSALTGHLRWAGTHLLIEGRAADGSPGWFAINIARARPTPLRLGSGTLIFADALAAWIRSGNSISQISLAKGRTAQRIDDVVAAGLVPLDPSSTGVRLLDNLVEPTIAVVIMHAGKRQAIIIDGHAASRSPIEIADADKILTVGRHHIISFAEDAAGVGMLTIASDDREPEILARTNIFLASRTVPDRIEIKSILSDGRLHSHWLFLPPNRDPARPPPLIAVIYPGMILDAGPDLATSPSFFLQPNNVSILVGHGFAVLTPSLPAVHNGPDPMGGLAADLDSAVDATLARHLVNADRIGVLGHSYGGFGALAVAARSTRYRAIVAVSGPYDLAAVHGAMTGPDRIRMESGLPLRQDAGWAEGGQAEMFTAPWTDPTRYIRKSPAYALDHVRIPVLLIHGETDVVALDQAERAFMGLARLGQDATLVRYWGEGHVLASPANIRDYWRRVLGWLDDRLKVRSSDKPPLAVPAGPSNPKIHGEIQH